MRPATYFFKRRMTMVVPLQPDVEGWTSESNGLYRTWVFSLQQVQDFTDFTNLFGLYKLSAVNVEMTLSSTNANVNTASASMNPSQIIVYTAPNPIGFNETLNEVYFLNTSSAKKRNLMNSNGRSSNFYMPLKQATQVFAGVSNDDYAVQRPKFISTSESATPHYGIDMRMQRVDGLPFSSGYSGDMYMKITTTYYIQCKQVQ